MENREGKWGKPYKEMMEVMDRLTMIPEQIRILENAPQAENRYRMEEYDYILLLHCLI